MNIIIFVVRTLKEGSLVSMNNSEKNTSKCELGNN
jgi:hypothetical protein